MTAAARRPGGLGRPRPRALRRPGALRGPGSLVVALALLALAGCAGIPAEGPVFEGRRIEGAQPGLAQLYPQGPVSGSSPRELVRGFLSAAPDYRNDHEVARSFLAGSVRSWRPAVSVLVYADEGATRIGVDGEPDPDPDEAV